ncbi:hypothetical protein D3C86_1671220 [compost metagenome]
MGRKIATRCRSTRSRYASIFSWTTPFFWPSGARAASAWTISPFPRYTLAWTKLVASPQRIRSPGFARARISSSSAFPNRLTSPVVSGATLFMCLNMNCTGLVAAWFRPDQSLSPWLSAARAFEVAFALSASESDRRAPLAAG